MVFITDNTAWAIKDNDALRALIAKCCADHPECFPPELENGFGFKDFRYSKKMDLHIRRIGGGLGDRPGTLLPTGSLRRDALQGGPHRRGGEGTLLAQVQCSLFFLALEHAFGKCANFCWRRERRLGINSSIAGSLNGRVESELQTDAETGEVTLLSPTVHCLKTLPATKSTQDISETSALWR
ncbi:MAG: hypothetical protein O3C21_03295 [Verrucomicrobia bacterium]|nr:hypothetical protein [Verrucomicrobiota bacterium]